MMVKIKNNPSFIWLILVLMTGTTYMLGKAGFSGLPVIGILLATVTIKGQLLVDYFMALKNVRPLWRWVVSGWLVTIVLFIGLAFWLGEH